MESILMSQIHYSGFTIKWATLDWEKEHAFLLRRRIFCNEQGIFQHSDKDDIDTHAQCLVALANYGGWHDKVVGTVRIHQPKEGVWWGSRLGVDTAFRSHTGLGSALIKLAVSSAHGLGCHQFLAQVQKQNEKLFQRLHWKSCFELDVLGMPHVMMEADLKKFPVCLQPNSGFMVRQLPVDYDDEIMPTLLYPHDLILQQSFVLPKVGHHAT